MCPDFTKAFTSGVVGQGITILKLSEGSLWSVEATEGITMWGSGYRQPTRINLLGLLTLLTKLLCGALPGGGKCEELSTSCSSLDIVTGRTLLGLPFYRLGLWL